jgi:hypothetical protein
LKAVAAHSFSGAIATRKGRPRDLVCGGLLEKSGCLL